MQARRRLLPLLLVPLQLAGAQPPKASAAAPTTQTVSTLVSAAAPTAEAASALVSAAVCRWSLEGTVSFQVRTSALTDAIADAEKAGATDPNAREGAAILRALVIRGEIDLPSGIARVDVRSAVPITDPARQRGLETIRNGTHEVLGGMMMTLSGHRQPYFGESPVTGVTVNPQGAWVLTLQGVDGELIVDAGTHLPFLARLKAGAGSLEQTMDPWRPDGACSWLGGVAIAESGKPATVALTFSWTDLAGARFPSGLTMTTPAGQQTVAFEQLAFTPASP